MKRYLFHMTLLAFAILTTGCGSLFGPGANYVSTKDYQIGSNDTSTGIDPWGNDNNYSCSEDYTITPNGTNHSDRKGYYEICTSSGIASYWNILVHGQTATSNTICVFPAQKNANGNLAWIRDPATNQPTSLCAPANASGAYFVFPLLSKSKIGFNSAFIVEGPDVEAMKQCLIQNFDIECPEFSLGTFR